MGLRAGGCSGVGGQLPWGGRVQQGAWVGVGNPATSMVTITMLTIIIALMSDYDKAVHSRVMMMIQQELCIYKLQGSFASH